MPIPINDGTFEKPFLIKWDEEITNAAKQSLPFVLDYAYVKAKKSTL